MLRVQILEGASINITTYFKEQQTKFLGGANQFLGGKSPPCPPPPPPEINPDHSTMIPTPYTYIYTLHMYTKHRYYNSIDINCGTSLSRIEIRSHIESGHCLLSTIYCPCPCPPPPPPLPFPKIRTPLIRTLYVVLVLLWSIRQTSHDITASTKPQLKGEGESTRKEVALVHQPST